MNKIYEEKKKEEGQIEKQELNRKGAGRSAGNV